MEQNKEIPAVTTQPAAPAAPLRFAPRDWLALGMGLGCAALWFAVFGLDNMFDDVFRLPALGAAAVTAALWAGVLLYLGRDAKWNRWNGGLAAMVGLLTLCCCVYGDLNVRVINYLLIAAGSVLCFFSLSGQTSCPLTRARAVPETVYLTLRALFSNWGKPFRALGGLGDGEKKTARQIALGVLCGAGLLAIVLPLLISADAVFGSLFSGLTHWLEGIDGFALWRILRVALLTLAFFSAFYFLRHGKAREATDGETPQRPAAPFVTALALLCAVYLIFCAIQFAFLFGGADTAAMEGGYAEYARSGFFQLVWVAAINLTVTLTCAALGGNRRSVRIMSTTLLALTGVILFSAFWRMRLYILAYGLTLKRAETLWAMAFIAVCLLLAALRVWKRGFRFWPFFAAIGLAGWILFNCVNIDARIAHYNVDAYLSGSLEQIDLGYLASTSPDALPALTELRDALGNTLPGDIAEQGLSGLIGRLQRQQAVDWTDWCVSYVRYK